MNLQELGEENILVKAIYPLHNLFMSDDSVGIELLSEIEEQLISPKDVRDLISYVRGDFSEHFNPDENAGNRFWDLPTEEQIELVRDYILSGGVAADVLVAEIGTPVPQFYSGGGVSYSWGHCYLGYVSGTSLASLYKNALTWKEGRYIEAERAFIEAERAESA